MAAGRLVRTLLLLFGVSVASLPAFSEDDSVRLPLLVTGRFADSAGYELRVSAYLPAGISAEPTETLLVDRVQQVDSDRFGPVRRSVPVLLCLVPEAEYASPISDRSPYRPLVLREAQEANPIVVAVAAIPPFDDESGHSVSAMIQLLDDLLAAIPDVDPGRVYLTGYAAATALVWRLAASVPHRVAAAVPISGSGDPGDARRLAGVPIWALHATVDPAPVLASREMVAALWAVGSHRIRYTEYKRGGAHSWERAWEDPLLVSWLFSQFRTRR